MIFGCLNRVSETRNPWRVTSKYCTPPSAIPTSNSDCNSLRILKNGRQPAKITTYLATFIICNAAFFKTCWNHCRETNSFSNIENVSESCQCSLLMSSRHNWRTFAFLSWENICVRNNNFRGREKFKILRRLGQPAK